ncbi:lysylphosphatidylglycerol synthase transmembrane domain-containing protein [Pedobacter sandarakinus]|uniref:lysylphosphatidylglycerol synthase transmembrane domain-containing protein n=1 Tax=Pedobacter sandarakinus TaxID=353156 RepID=UPI00224786DF|nr:lysylphosphatidylglycerol synthase transmembrane domain-containing protein [Pedobacter sandarakinus]MCX2573438.1 lysylphosphatidylglycerol synthase transmembrane domain-containing protein [Pedobacter sandarakinus]
MKFDLKTALKYILLFLIGIGVLYLAFKGQDLSKIWREIRSANYFWIIVSAFMVWVAHVLRALRWQMLYRSIHYDVSFWNVYHAVIIGYLANLALPRFGEIGRCTSVHKTDRVPMFAAIGTVITERLFDVLVLLATGLAVVVFQYNIVYQFLYQSIYVKLWQKLINLNFLWLLAIGAIVALSIAFGIYIVRKKVGRKLLRVLVGLRQGFGSYHKLKQKQLFIAYTLGIWVAYLLSMYFCFLAILPTQNLGLAAAFTALVFSGFAMAAPVQGGIGVFHWMVAQALALYGVVFKDALAYATIIHSSQVLLILILGSLSSFKVISKVASR